MARVEGHGPVTEAWLRQHLGPHARFTVRPVLDLAGQAPVDAYEIPDRHRQAVHLMTPADTFPWGSSTSRTQQIDHTVRLPARCGQTRRAVEGGQLRPDDPAPPPDQDPRRVAGAAALRRDLRVARPARCALPRRPHRHPTARGAGGPRQPRRAGPRPRAPEVRRLSRTRPDRDVPGLPRSLRSCRCQWPLRLAGCAGWRLGAGSEGHRGHAPERAQGAPIGVRPPGRERVAPCSWSVRRC